jgi:hypothetical protein
MATVATLAQAQADLILAHDAITASNWATARLYIAAGLSIMAAIHQSVGDQGATVSLRASFRDLQDAVNAAETSSKTASGDHMWLRPTMGYRR